MIKRNISIICLIALICFFNNSLLAQTKSEKEKKVKAKTAVFSAAIKDSNTEKSNKNLKNSNNKSKDTSISYNLISNAKKQVITNSFTLNDTALINKKTDSIFTKKTTENKDSVSFTGKISSKSKIERTENEKDTFLQQKNAENKFKQESIKYVDKNNITKEINHIKKNISYKMLLVKIIVLIFSLIIIISTIKFIRKYFERQRFLTTTRLSVMDKEVQKACRYIEKNYLNPFLNVEMICKDLVTGKAFLEALMEKELGITVEDFIDHVRINNARAIIENEPNISKEVLASKVGYRDVDIFTNAFVKITGAHFEDYLNLLKNKNEKTK